MDQKRATPSKMLTILAVENVQRSRDFYRAVFGWSVREDMETYVEFDTGMDTGICLYERGAFAKNTGTPVLPVMMNSSTGVELYIYVSDMADTINKLVSANASMLAARKVMDWGDEVAYYSDPDGHIIAVAQG
ncbi:MAG TPA: hypothetical protein ENH10_04030 [Bacteroidetes bacterium]|nr:glyoxalase-like domain protein [bacterium BMS3Bbin04]HDO65187.1 hypothetical protein [Bacteroidota bacterium]HEX04312.1 hypothetical protein [Bacteroidota bacterium]